VRHWDLLGTGLAFGRQEQLWMADAVAGHLTECVSTGSCGHSPLDEGVCVCVCVCVCSVRLGLLHGPLRLWPACGLHVACMTAGADPSPGL
jgi:hypothetical protein